MAHRRLTGVLLVGGASTRFGSAKALARVGDETLAERAWRVLGEACDERLAVGKRDELALPFDVLDDETEVRAPIAGVVAGLRASAHEVTVFLPVDCPRITPAALTTFGQACRDVAVTAEGPLPGAWARSALPVLERRLHERRLALVDAYDDLDVAFVDVDPSVVSDADTPEELEQLLFHRPRPR